MGSKYEENKNSKERQLRELPAGKFVQPTSEPQGNDAKLVARLRTLYPNITLTGSRWEHAPDCDLLTPQHRKCNCKVRLMVNETVYE
jgi:hypothetical protein